MELIHLNPGFNLFEIWREMAKDMRDKLKEEGVNELIVPAWLFNSGSMPEYAYLMTYSREHGIKITKEEN